MEFFGRELLDLGSYSDDVSLVKSPRYQKIFLQTSLLSVIIDFIYKMTDLLLANVKKTCTHLKV